MLELHDTLKNEHGWDIVALHQAVDELLACCRLDQPAFGDDGWSADRVLFAEIVVTEGDNLVGAGRLVWDADQPMAPPRIIDLCLLKRYRDRFVVDSMLSALIDGYAEQADQADQADAGTTVLAHDGQEIDISERVERLRNIAAGQYEPRVI